MSEHSELAASPEGVALSAMAQLPGAVLSTADVDGLAEPCGSGNAHPVAAHYGDPFGEQWALQAGKALVDRADLQVVEVRGVDRHTWLNAITTQRFTSIHAGGATELLILNPQGHVTHAAAVFEDGQSTYLITEGVDAEGLAEFLNSMRFAMRVEVSRRDDLTVYATAGTTTDTAAGLPGHMATWVDPWPEVAEGGAAYFQGDHPGAPSRMKLHLIHKDEDAAFVDAWMSAEDGRKPAGLNAWEALRIASWRPRLGYETDERSHPAELDWLRTAVHTNKGCYPGQEAVARILNVGRPPRRLVFLHLDGSRGDVPQPGTAITYAGRSIGRITSVARHAELGPIALALIARDVPADAVFDIDGVAAAQQLIVPLDGKSSKSLEARPGAELLNPQLRNPRGVKRGALMGKRR